MALARAERPDPKRVSARCKGITVHLRQPENLASCPNYCRGKNASPFKRSPGSRPRCDSSIERLGNVRFTPTSDQRTDIVVCLKRANIRHATYELTPVLPAVSWLSISATVERASRPCVVSGDCTATESLQDQVCNAPSNCVACLTSEVSNPSVNDAHRGPSNSRHSPLRPW